MQFCLSSNLIFFKKVFLLEKNYVLLCSLIISVLSVLMITVLIHCSRKLIGFCFLIAFKNAAFLMAV